MKFIRHLTAGVFFPAIISLLFLTGCGGGGLLADGGIIGTGSITGTVPGTVIEAYGDQGQYIETFSEINDTDRHPFLLQLPAGVGFYLVMIINEGTPNEIVMPIAFPDDQGQLFARFTLQAGQILDLGHIPLYLNCDDVMQFEPDEDCTAGEPYIFKNAFILNDDEDSRNPLREMDADDDGIDDYEDEDHGYGHQNGSQFKDPQDLDDDRVPNRYDDDYSPGPNDDDKDGIDDDEDENPGNIPDDDSEENSLLDWNGQGMHPVGQAWREQHGEHAEQNLENCASCHGDDFRGTPISAQVGCYDCHDGPGPEDDVNPDGGYTWQQWNGQGMHPQGQMWREQHGDYVEYNNYDSCASCHGNDFRGTPLSAQVGCYDCHDGPDPEDD